MDTGPGTATPTHTWSHAAEDMLFTGANFVQVSGGAAFIAARPTTIRQAVNRAATY
jgi:hypothetical protein